MRIKIELGSLIYDEDDGDYGIAYKFANKGTTVWVCWSSGVRTHMNVRLLENNGYYDFRAIANEDK